MPSFRWHMPVDPTCPTVREWNETFWNDPMTAACGCSSEIAEDFERRHAKACERCQQYGCENIEVTNA